MALAIDGSTPAIATQATGSVATVTTASFTPPSGSLLLIRYSANTIDPNDPGNPAITDSLGGHLTYTSWDIGKRPDSPLAEGQVATWTAPVVSSAAMTVTVTNGAASPNRHAALNVTVLTGADTTTPVGAHGKSSSLSAASIAQNYTASATNGWGFLVVCDWFDAGAETAGTGCTLEGSADLGGQFTYAFIRRTAADDSNGVTNTLRATVPGTSTSLRWAWIEILPAVVAAGGAAGPVLTPPAGQLRRFAGTAITLDHGTVVQAPAADVPNIQVQPSNGTQAWRAGTALLITPRADPSAAQNQPIPVVVVVAGRPPIAVGQAFVTTPHADPSTAAPPVEAPIVAAGRAGPTSGSVSVWAPRSEPSPAQNQAVPLPVAAAQLWRQPPGSAQTIAPRADPAVVTAPGVTATTASAGRPAVLAGASWTTTPRADPDPGQNQPIIEPVVSAGRPAPLAGTAVVAASRTDPIADTPPVIEPVYAVARVGIRSGTSLLLGSPGQDVDGRPAVTVAGGARTPFAAPAVLLRSTFTIPAVAFIHPPILSPGIRLPRLGSVWLQRPTEFTDHFCPPPTPRPDTGATARPDTGTTAWLLALTLRPDSGITPRPDTGVTTEC